ncbi:DNA-3-methyladenine glycosylase I [Streptococcus loxodontisalivarius]|uniref:DNA-3-methyladenine glycosylase I n=1 Tax=Streptococcus loxodontisalivarius TaxID=1349415 RepID=A0ABS2PR19_9STRE|nr:DNA-3-methyladenine glycosylase I [Streptococcus loxodontisalivarius]
MKRCGWVPVENDLYRDYHDQEWGKPLHDDQALFELLCLESYQSGLSWLTVLKKRTAFRQVFHSYQIDRVADFSEEEMAAALENPAIIRHRLKLEATVNNAKAIQRLQAEVGSFSDYIWSFVDHKPLVNQVSTYLDRPSQTELSQKIAKDLKKRGFKFLGPTTIYSFLQAAGLINDHEDSCAFK